MRVTAQDSVALHKVEVQHRQKKKRVPRTCSSAVCVLADGVRPCAAISAGRDVTMRSAVTGSWSSGRGFPQCVRRFIAKAWRRGAAERQTDAMDRDMCDAAPGLPHVRRRLALLPLQAKASFQILTHLRFYKTKQDIQGRSRNHCYSAKSVCGVLYSSECVCVALGIQRAMGISSIVLLTVVCLSVSLCNILPHYLINDTIFFLRIKTHEMLVLILILPHYLINDTIFFFKLKPTQCLF
jgi:hypothetical protein